MKSLILLCVLLVASQAKVFKKCELSRVMKQNGLADYLGITLPNWVCMAYQESGYNTQVIQHISDGSTSYGIFQINSHHWCDDGKTRGARNDCKISCFKFLDGDLRDDIECAKKIAQIYRGMSAWVGWTLFCRGHDLYQYKC
ncbi:lysozyme C I-like [Tachyglossus aculeatus]|uniref:lysozyme C I-like n=1 Tax=Tachyglossus aculeatus TaxID=9261 RepID=UPI0018F7C552|nr:lysozyme C I-like [Tachyglossus aculeatus]XP_038609232.1 lysozyme C I-like [Tachyglossus aculeatus]